MYEELTDCLQMSILSFKTFLKDNKAFPAEPSRPLA